MKSRISTATQEMFTSPEKALAEQQFLIFSITMLLCQIVTKYDKISEFKGFLAEHEDVVRNYDEGAN